MDFTCKYCECVFEAEEEMKGEEAACPSCNRTIIIGEEKSKLSVSIPKPDAAPTQLPEGLEQPAPAGDSGVVWASPNSEFEIKPGYTLPMTWVWAVVYPVVTTLISHGILALITLKYKPMPNWVIIYAPILLAILVSMAFFVNEAGKSVRERLPSWVMLAGLAICASLGFGISFTLEATHKKAVRRSITSTMVSEFTAPAFNSKNMPSLLSASLGKGKGGNYAVNLKYAKNQAFSVSIKRNLNKVTAVNGVLQMRQQVMLKFEGQAIRNSLSRYQPIAKAKISEFTLTEKVKSGTYYGTMKVGPDSTFDIEVYNGKGGVMVKLRPESHRAAATISEATRLWRQLNPGSRAVCKKVEMGKVIDDMHWEAKGTLSDDSSIALIVKDDGKKVTAFFPSKEAAILKINKLIKDSGRFGAIPKKDKCVNLKKVGQLRTAEEIMQAVFVESSPANLVVRELDYSIKIYPGDWQLIAGDSLNQASQGWSLIVPGSFTVRTNPKDKFIKEGGNEKTGETLSLNSKDISNVASFSLSSYVQKEKDEWKAKYKIAKVESTRSFKTLSGLKGYSYRSSIGTVMRIKYFLQKDNSLAIFTYTDKTKTDTSDAMALLLAESIRYKDDPGK